MIRIVFITSEHRRHRWVAAQLAAAGELVAVVSEKKPAGNLAKVENQPAEIVEYSRERDCREAYWFADAPADFEELGTKVRRVNWGGSNEETTFRFVTELKPDVVFLFGSSIVREPLLSHFNGRIINMHLGLSPYYRGSGTNFWPLVDGLPECVGVTIHHAILKVDGGKLLLQARPAATEEDTSHDLGCKSIMEGAKLLQRIVHLGAEGPLPQGVTQGTNGKLCRRDDFSLDALRRMQQKIADGMMRRYVQEKNLRDSHYPIVEDILSNY